MPCKNCKKNAKMMVDVVKDAISKPNNPKSDCDKNREKELSWLSTPEGRYLLDQIKLSSTQNIILWVGAYIPLLIGYVTIIKFIVNLF
jgi:hypothetical protein